MGTLWQTAVPPNNRCAHFVSWNSRKRHKWIETAKRIQITSAESDHLDFQQNIAIHGHRRLDGLDRGVSWSVEYKGLQCAPVETPKAVGVLIPICVPDL